MAPTPSPGKRRRLHEEISGDRSQPQAQRRVLSQAVRLWVLADKLESSEIEEAYGLAQELGALRSSDIKFANLVLTAVKAPKRVWLALRRESTGSHLSDEWLRSLNVLHVDWLADTEEKGIMQAYDAYRIVLPRDTAGSAQKASPSASSSSIKKQVASPSCIKKESPSPSSPPSSTPVIPTSPPPPAWTNSEYSCQRPSPLHSAHNQPLVDELEIIRKQRDLTSQRWSERSYSMCLSAIKAYPRQVCSQSLKEVKSLKGVGPKMIGIIEQFCSSGQIVEAQQILSDPANPIMFSFMELYGVGPVAARELYEDGCRSNADVVARGKSLATHLDVADCLGILPDLKLPIPRAEVEEIASLLYEEARVVLPGCRYTICGGYRRGKPRSNDVDVVISHEGNGARIHDILDRLKRKGIMSYNVNVLTHSDEARLDAALHLNVAEIVVLPPRSAIVPHPKHRRVDLVMCPPQIYGAAVIGWTGAKTFEKDIRRWAKLKGYKFHSTGLRARETGELVETPTEEDVFRLLGLRWMPPEWRNTDA